ncbi:MAG: acyltransferase [Porphyrobacter sp.]|nr:acyltransferase [Porphyrobacter sp.]
MSTDLVRKKSPGRLARAVRLAASLLDPRAWFHLVRIMNYYNYTHVAQMRLLTIAGTYNISPDAVFQNAERIIIGQRVRIGSRCHLWAGPSKGRIVIGDDVLFGPEVMLTAATYRHDLGHPVTDQPMAEADIVIGNDVWLATRAVVLPGTRLGDGCIVAAGSVVRGDFPPKSIIAGSPARIVSQRIVRGPAAEAAPEGN